MLLPVRGALAAGVDWLTLAAIFALFFLHGVRLPREALISGVTHWRLHAGILAATFLAFPLIGLALSSLFPGLLTPALWTGMLFLCALPSTVQSSIAYTSMAGGNVAGAVAAAAFSNLIGVFLTPALVTLMLQAQGAEISLAGIGKIVMLLFFPFLLGHGLRPLLIGRSAAAPAWFESWTRARSCSPSTAPFRRQRWKGYGPACRRTRSLCLRVFACFCSRS